ncbi:hypothetical protein D3C78_1014680 [compost metagenome]
MRGNIEQWFRQLNWAAYTAEMIGNTNRIIDGLIDLLGGRVARWVLDTQGLQRLINQLKLLKSKASQKITEAMDSLKQAHQQAMMQPLPNTTAHVPARPSAPPRPAPGSQAPAPAPTRNTPHTQANKPADTSPQGEHNRNLPANTGGTTTPRQGQAVGQQRQSQRSRYSRHRVGVQGEHIADYYFVKNKKTREKINNSGVLYEGRQPGHQGIDHVWFSQSAGNTYRISDTKGTNEPIFKRLQSIVDVTNALMEGLEHIVDEDDEATVRNSVGRTQGDGRQMSHLWIARRIDSAKILPLHRMLLSNIKAWERLGYDSRTAACPYQRSLITVVGPNFIQHDGNATKNNANNTPAAGKCRKAFTRHQIANEFVIPTRILRE